MHRSIATIGLALVLAATVGCRTLGSGRRHADRYDVVFKGAEPSSLSQAMVDASQCVAQKGERVDRDMLEELCLVDQQVMRDVLRSQGYYLGEAGYRITGSSPAKVRFDITPGPRFTLSSIEIDMSAAGSVGNTPPVTLALRPGDAATAASILAQEKLIRLHYRNNGHPWAQVTSRRVVVSRSNQTASVSYVLTPGPVATFGPTAFTGSDAVREKHLRRYISWTEGACYREAETLKLQSDLLGSGLFSSVRIVPTQPEPNADGELPLDVQLRDRKHRSLNIGIQYWSDDGLGGNFTWQHRNMRRAGESLSISARGSSREVYLETRYEIPYFRRRDQSVALVARIEDESTDAYDARVYAAGSWLQRDLTSHIIAGGGLRLQHSDIEEFSATNDYNLLSAPLIADLNYAGDLLNPTKGGRVRIYAEPFVQVDGPDLRFLRTALELRAYVPLDHKRRYVVAARSSLGTILGETRTHVPANQRYYAGGGGSIRGYEFQSVGPDVNGVPIGGLSSFLVSAEIRARIKGPLALVLFTDGGMTYEESLPDRGEPLTWGAGGGIRYHTPVGPLRVDLAFPIEREADNTTTRTFYISLGQAF